MLEESRKVHDIFMGNVHLSLVKDSMQRISPKVQILIKTYGSY